MKHKKIISKQFAASVTNSQDIEKIEREEKYILEVI